MFGCGYVKCSVSYKGEGSQLNVRVIRERFCERPASTYHSLIYKTGEEVCLVNSTEAYATNVENSGRFIKVCYTNNETYEDTNTSTGKSESLVGVSVPSVEYTAMKTSVKC
jgi:hypothetical protein